MNHRLAPLFTALGCTALAFLLRIYLLQDLGTRVIWLTFYPSVVIAGVMQGFAGGSLATIFSCVAAYWIWPLVAPGIPIKDNADFLGMAVFFGNCLLISAVTEAMRRARSEAKRAGVLADQANQAKTVFLTNISHELRTPLNAILGFTQLLSRDQSLSTRQLGHLQTIRYSGEHLLHLINNVINISRIESGRITLDTSTTNLDQLIDDTLAMVRWKTDTRGVGLVLEREPGVPSQITIDGGKLRQILLNLLGNASKFTERGEITLRIRNLPADPPRHQPPRLHIDVVDTGRGMDSELLKKLFTPFVQGSIQPINETGSGLGLAISRQTAKTMGGSIEVTSEPGRGSCFTLVLPYQPAADERDKSATAGVSTVPLKLAPGTPRHRLLMVEDEAINRQLLREILAPFDFDLREANNGQEALDQIGDWQPELIWMDMRMPVMDGHEATRRIRQLPTSSNIRIIALTAHALESERQQIRDVGCDEVLQKPYHMHEILAVLTRVLGVEFIAQADASVASIAASELAARLAALPPAQLKPLTDAVVSLEAAACHAAIQPITAPDLATHLHRMVDDFRYRELWLAASDAERMRPAA